MPRAKQVAMRTQFHSRVADTEGIMRLFGLATTNSGSVVEAPPAPPGAPDAPEHPSSAHPPASPPSPPSPLPSPPRSPLRSNEAAPLSPPSPVVQRPPSPPRRPSGEHHRQRQRVSSQNPPGEPYKRRSSRFKPGELALREIRRLQRGTDTLIRKLPFSRLVRQLLAESSADRADFRIGVTAMQALQEATEAFVVELFELSYLCTLHGKRDMHLARRLLGGSL
eukprot:m51a1_g2988 putative histone-fold-containing protein (223) ;mRNA; r:742065-743030